MTEPSANEHVLTERPQAHPGVLVIRFNRPEKKNALTEAMYLRIVAALELAEADETVRAIAFLGTEGCFTAGNDMGDFLAYALSDGSKLPAAAVLLKALVAASKPLVSGIDGLAIGIGTTLNMHCDLTVASSRSLFKTPFVDLALVPEAASSLLAPLSMGHQRAFALLAMGEGFSAEAAREAGLIWKVVEPDAVESETLAIAANLAKKPPQALKIARDLLRGDRNLVLARIDEELAHFKERLKSAEARAAFETFLAKKTI
ncbi:crotonase/enoyl-CoA hydratase family protein [Allorhizobium taibaishanense]|uniref:Enoyl-CoA hydratase n=1 Tax=Allorhizobium taibaishanense TaxID=887144 RepID=A0A1Q9AAC6_9HYPH|nr:crotonase/enoyl-CoA hydratase family protein [Allorhizobium taibaishanense]MBB4006999.1 enoyl-CoA hydratase/carnithine racemase [Allorhizobium taibaishanense]OLP51817.1 enoyl-CoA hydratase [Allorhizobium taibaishanense]